MNAAELWQKLKPHAARDLGNNITSNNSASGGLAAHALSGSFHTGTLAESQAPWVATNISAAISAHSAAADPHLVYVKKAGDVMTGTLTINAATNLMLQSTGTDRASIIAGANTLDLSPLPDSSGNMNIRLFRNTNTTGTKALQLMAGDGTSTHVHQLTVNGTTVFNVQLSDLDFNVRGDTDANLLYADASTDRIGVGRNDPAYKLDVNGTLRASTSLTTPQANGTTTFTTGFTGAGYRLDDGVATAGKTTLELDEMIVRGRMRVYELLIHQIRATNGSIFVTGVGKAKTVTGTGPYTIVTETDHGFAANDLIRAQRFTGSGVYQSNLLVTAVATTTQFTATLSSGDAPAAGMEFVRLGNTTDSTRQGSIYLTADDTFAPAIDILDGVASFADWGSASKIKVRLGKLTSSLDSSLLPSGYGLYAPNAYLSGDLLTGGGAIRIYNASGINIAQDTWGSWDNKRALQWWPDVASMSGDPSLSMYTGKVVGGLTNNQNFSYIDANPTGGVLAGLSLTAFGQGTAADAIIYLEGGSQALSTTPSVTLTATTIDLVGGIQIDGTTAARQMNPQSDLGYSLGTALLRWNTIYANQIIATTVSGATMSGAEWEYAGSMVIDANSASNTTVSVVNQGAGLASLDVENNITLGGTVDGVDVAAFKTSYDAHVAAADPHSGYLLASGSRTGATSSAQSFTSGINTSAGIGIGLYTTTSAAAIRARILSTADANFYGSLYGVHDVSGAISATNNAYGIFSQIVNSRTSADVGANLNALTGISNIVYNGASAAIYAAYGVNNSITNFATAGTITTMSGGINQVTNSSTGSITTVFGTQNVVTNSSTGAITTLYANYGSGINDAGATITTAYGTYGQVRNDQGTIGSAYGAFNLAFQLVAGGTITTGYGTYSQVRNDAGTIGTGYLYYGVFSGAGTTTTKRGIWLVGETENSLSGTLTTGALTVNTTGNHLTLEVATVDRATIVASATTFDINPLPDSTANMNVRLFRTTNTTGAKRLQLLAGDNTATTVHQLSITDTTIFNAQLSDLDFNVRGDTDANLIFVDASTDRVGFGTNAPTVKLHVVGSGYISSDIEVGGEILAANGTAGAPSYSFSSDTNTGMYSSSADVLEFTAGGTRRALISTSSIDTTVRINAAPDTDTNHFFGRLAIGQPVVNDSFSLAHYDNLTSTNYALHQYSTGETRVNAANGQTVSLSVAGTPQWIVNSDRLLPRSTVAVDIGDYNRRVRTLHAAELAVETLVAQNVMATIGGRILVAPTVKLIADLNSTGTNTAFNTNLQSWWSLNETTGTRSDSRGSNSLTSLNSVSYASGKQSNAASFTGASSMKLNIADNASLSVGDIDFLVCAWIYPTLNNGGRMTIIHKGSAATGEYRLDIDWSTYKAYFAVWNSSGTMTEVSSSGTPLPAINTWYFLCGWHDTTNNVIGISVNGTETTAAHSTGVRDGTGNFTIGARDTDQFYTGRIDEVAYWKNYLPSYSERGWLYNKGAGRTYTEVNTQVQSTIDVDGNSLQFDDFVYMSAAPGGIAQIEAMKIISNATSISGGYRYTVIRNMDGTGLNSWSAGDAVVDIGAYIGDGYIDITSTSTIHNQLGPTMTIYQRYGSGTWNETTPTVALGNLRSFVDYSSTNRSGIAIGNDLTLTPTTGFQGITADATNGIRLFSTDIKLYNGSTQTVNIDNAGTDLWIGTSIGDKRLSWDGSLLGIIGAITVTAASGFSGSGYLQVGSGTKDTSLNGWNISSSEIVGQASGVDKVQLATDGTISVVGTGAFQIKENATTLKGYIYSSNPLDSLILNSTGIGMKTNGSAATEGISLRANSTSSRSAEIAINSSSTGSITAMVYTGTTATSGQLKLSATSFSVALNGLSTDDLYIDSSSAQFNVDVDLNGNDIIDIGTIGESWTTLTLNSSGNWANYGGNYHSAAYKKIGDMVFLRGLVKRTSGSNSLIATLPSGYWPSSYVLRSTSGDDLFARIDIENDGEMRLQAGTAASYVSLDGLWFSTA